MGCWELHGSVFEVVENGRKRWIAMGMNDL